MIKKYWTRANERLGNQRFVLILKVGRHKEILDNRDEWQSQPQLQLCSRYMTTACVFLNSYLMVLLWGLFKIIC